MWNLFNCYLSGRHDYGMWCEPGAIFLRCVHCGKRSSGWAVTAEAGRGRAACARGPREGGADEAGTGNGQRGRAG